MYMLTSVIYPFSSNACALITDVPLLYFTTLLCLMPGHFTLIPMIIAYIMYKLFLSAFYVSIHKNLRNFSAKLSSILLDDSKYPIYIIYFSPFGQILYLVYLYNCYRLLSLLSTLIFEGIFFLSFY